MKSGENWSSGFREEDVKDFLVLYLYIAQGQGQITPRVGGGDKILILTKTFYYFNHTL